MTVLLELRDLRCERDDRCLFQHLNLQVNPGQIIQVVGPNGSGKTTLLRILTQLSQDYQGDIFWQGQPLAAVRFDFLQNLLFLGHLPGIKKALTPKENLAWYNGLVSPRQDYSILQALDAVGLYGYDDIPCHQLSAGQLRRVALARLYLSAARLWVLDEPFTAIDKQGVEKLEAVMEAHVAKGGSIILTTHQDVGIQALTRLNLSDFLDGNLSDNLSGNPSANLTDNGEGETHAVG